jgi:hypothetical protein
MQNDPVTVNQLEEYWKAVSAAKEGDSFHHIPLSRMPPWENICSELSWHHYLLSGGYFSEKHHGYRGVYRLIGLASAGKLNEPVALNRVCKQDTSGTLYIGCAGRLHERLNQMRVRRPTHDAITALQRIPALDFPKEKLAVALLYTGRAFRTVETMLIEAYMNTFGDTPPLNYRIY